MFHIQGAPKHSCNLLIVFCGRTAENEQKQIIGDEKRKYPFPELISSGCLEVQTLKNPSRDEFLKVLDTWKPNIVYLQGEQLSNSEVGSLVWGGVNLSVEAVCGLFSTLLPTMVYLELPSGEKFAEALQAKGVGNTLKRHYETYLLEYELAHDDVDGECCLLCHSSAAGDWVNCGVCGEWAHFGCDRRPGLGAFKDYAKTDGLEYICLQCSVSSFKKKVQKPSNGYS